jgi:transcription-repair coupling factor (superfamily II helicase)
MEFKVLATIEKANAVTSVPTVVSALYLAGVSPKGSRVVITPDENTAEELFSFSQLLSEDPEQIILFPSWDSRPEYQSSPNPQIQAERLSVLFRMLNRPLGLTVICSIDSLSQKLPPQEYVLNYSDVIKPNDEMSMDKITLDLTSCGYQKTDLVEQPGTFSVRGSIIDIYSPSENDPVRIELFSDFVETIKKFDPSTQRTISDVNAFFISPVKEVSFSEQSILLFKEKLKAFLDQKDVRKDIRDQLVEFVENNVYFPGIEYYLPFFYNNTSVFADYVAQGAEVIFIDDYIFDNKEGTNEHELDPEAVPYPLQDLFIPASTVLDRFHGFKSKKIYSVEFHVDDAVSIKGRISEPSHIRMDIWDYHKKLCSEGYVVFYSCSTKIQAERVEMLIKRTDPTITLNEASSIGRLLRTSPMNALTTICISPLNKGFILEEERIAVITETEVFGEKKRTSKPPAKNYDAFLNVFKELKENDHVVHSLHGIGIYKGLKKLEIEKIENDFFQIEYAGGDTLFVPVYRLNSVQKYVGQGGDVRLDKLGGTTWSKKKAKAKKSAMELAEKLVKIQAERRAKKGFAFSAPDELFLQFEAEFEYEETPDQLRSINDVIYDMEQPAPMDRLVCGDVGFGKTEVAIRAAFKAVKDKKQVALIAPTTILALQHYQIFKKRFTNYPVNIQMLTRFRSSKEQSETAESIKKGEVDIVIGTHRLLSSDVRFFDLGLLVIDEEQKFGVKQKEKIKELSPNVDIISMTATPIPRTLNMAFTGLKDISIITTPPMNRLPIRTFVAKFSTDLIRKAILTETKRGGQVFFVHNRVQDLEELYQKLKEIVPEAKIIMAHGQMEEKDLENKMLLFYNQEADVLLCTAIIESGLDIPNANTIIINRSDMMGLSQLYQIRGRVGRSPKPAFCYLLLPSTFTVGQAAIDRIKTLQRFTELGSGFNVASYDLEFRGAGELLGSSQSGFIDDIGLEEYLKLIEESVQSIKGETKIEDVDTEISVNTPAFIPETYIGSITQRLYFYKKIANAASEEDLEDIDEELKDRFGPVPEEVMNLFSLVTIKQHLRPLRVTSVKIGAGKLVYTFDKTTNIMPEAIVALVTKMPDRYRLTPEMKLISNIGDKDGINAIKEIKDFISLVRRT